jgi:heme-degrading monooxygenase HmoA
MSLCEQAGYVVVDVWRVKPGKEDAIRSVLATAQRQFSEFPGIVSIDYALVDGDPSRYLVVFRYRDQQAREEFVATSELKETMNRLRDYWDLDGIFFRGPAAPLD